MRWARLLNAPERVEVLETDRPAGQARIRRYGFIQTVPLRDLVFEEEEPSTLSSPISSPISSPREFSIRLQLEAGQKEATFLISAGTTGVFCGLYLRSRDTGPWHPIYQGLLEASTEKVIPLSLETYSPPWQLYVITSSIYSAAMPHRPTPSIQEATLRPLFFAQSGILSIPFESARKPMSIPPLPKESVSVPKPQTLTDLSNLSPELDLHIEKLAPDLQGARPEIIFDLQLRILTQYIDRAQRCGLAQVVVIHGIGNQTLKKALEQFCWKEGLRCEPLLLKPYDGGATCIYLL